MGNIVFGSLKRTYEVSRQQRAPLFFCHHVERSRIIQNSSVIHKDVYSVICRDGLLNCAQHFCFFSYVRAYWQCVFIVFNFCSLPLQVLIRSRPMRTTLQPSCASLFDVAFPTPPPAPVTIATFPLRLMFISR